MAYLTLLIIAAWGALSGHGMGAAAIWCIGVAAIHMIEEYQGKLWAYFGRIAKNQWLEYIGDAPGFELIVLPAFLLQALAAIVAFGGDTVSPLFLGLIVGARIGDALFSHAIPAAAMPDAGRNPGLPSAAVYAVDGLLMTLVWHVPLMAAPWHSIAGAAVGAVFFAAVLPGLRLLASLF